jgi:hypothetical protein
MARGLYCTVHTHENTIPQEDHHVWPKGYHGPNIQSNMIRICCNAHSDVHYYMDYRLKHNGERSPEWRTYGYLIRYWADRGYYLVIKYGEELSAQIEQEGNKRLPGSAN